MKGVNYLSRKAPEDYTCSVCAAHGVKLWRAYSISHVELFCYDCARNDQEEPGDMPNCDQIYGLVPAVPDEEDISYWGYTSVPTLGCWWWWQLPPFADDRRVLTRTVEALPTLYAIAPKLHAQAVEDIEVMTKALEDS
tara:strand:- start:1099 stop:1512 length:414 start_codon:yes stop_codon:yes gene_type:complete